MDAKHTSWMQAAVDLKALIVTAIGTEHCATVASTHPNGALRNCSALFIMEWLETEYGTIESHHVTERLATLDVVLTSSDQWPAHAAFFTTTIRRLRMAERRLPITIVPSDQALFIRLKASFANLREFDTSMGTFMSTNCTIQSQTCDRLVAFLKTQKGFIRSQATSAQFAGSMQSPAPAPAPQQQQQRQSRKQRKGRKGRSPSPSTAAPAMDAHAFAAMMSQYLQPPMHHPHLPPPQPFGQPYVHPHYGFAMQQPPSAPLPPGLGAPKYCYIHGYTMSTRGHDGIGCNVMKNGPQYTDAMKRATSHLDCPGGSTNNVVCMNTIASVSAHVGKSPSPPSSISRDKHACHPMTTLPPALPASGSEGYNNTATLTDVRPELPSVFPNLYLPSSLPSPPRHVSTPEGRATVPLPATPARLAYAHPNQFEPLSSDDDDENCEGETTDYTSRFTAMLSSNLSTDPAICDSGCTSILVRASFLQSILHLYTPDSSLPPALFKIPDGTILTATSGGHLHLPSRPPVPIYSLPDTSLSLITLSVCLPSLLLTPTPFSLPLPSVFTPPLLLLLFSPAPSPTRLDCGSSTSLLLPAPHLLSQ